MKTVFVNTSDLKGGAAIACYRLFKAVQQKGIEASLIVTEKLSRDENVISIHNSTLSAKTYKVKMLAEYAIFNKLFKNKKLTTTFSTAYFGSEILNIKQLQEADIINLHWINLSFLNLENLQQIAALNKPIIWHLHDMWAFTGGCHYSNGCENYLTECKNCPFLNSPADNDIANAYFKLKTLLFNNNNFTIVTPSNWLANEAKKSALLKNKKVIALGNAIPTNKFVPKNKIELKTKNGLNPAKKHILFGAMNIEDERKGFIYFKQALQTLSQDKNFCNNNELVILGKYNPEIFEGINPKLKINPLGFVSNQDKIAEVYALSDIFVIPTLEDNLPNTILEALSCGTPVVSFNTGGISDMVKHNFNGYIAEAKNANELAVGINSVLKNEQNIPFAQNARNYIVENYSEEVIAEKYISLYKTLI
ncbi:MAG: glycosyltransferase [Bacteroidota bacterium]